MEPIYVTGHRNPDTDSIVSAMAYAALRNALGDREFVPARLGHISDETRLVLDRFGFEPPVRIQTMRTQVRDLDYDTPPALSGAVTVSRAWAACRIIQRKCNDNRIKPIGCTQWNLENKVRSKVDHQQLQHQRRSTQNGNINPCQPL